MKTEDVEKIASLARLQLTAEETQSMAAELTQILKYVETLDTLDLKNIVPTAHAIEVDNVFRADTTATSTVGQTTLAQSPDHADDFFLVPKVL